VLPQGWAGLWSCKPSQHMSGGRYCWNCVPLNHSAARPLQPYCCQIHRVLQAITYAPEGRYLTAGHQQTKGRALRFGRGAEGERLGWGLKRHVNLRVRVETEQAGRAVPHGRHSRWGEARRAPLPTGRHGPQRTQSLASTSSTEHASAGLQLGRTKGWGIFAEGWQRGDTGVRAKC